MPQLWKTGRPAAPTPASNQPAKGFLICPPLVLGNGGEPSGNGCFPSSPPSSPSSPTGHQHPPKYDQLLNELRRAQVKTKEFVLCFLYFARNKIRTIPTAKRKGGGRVIAFYRSSRATTTKKKRGFHCCWLSRALPALWWSDIMQMRSSTPSEDTLLIYGLSASLFLVGWLGTEGSLANGRSNRCGTDGRRPTAGSDAFEKPAAAAGGAADSTIAGAA